MEKRILVCTRCGAIIVDSDLKVKWGNHFLCEKYKFSIMVDYISVDLCPVCTRDLIVWLGLDDKKH